MQLPIDLYLNQQSDGGRGTPMTDERLEERPDVRPQRLVERLVALRGATTVEADIPAAVMSRTRELLSALLERNEVDVVGGNPNTIRVLIHCYSTLPRASLRHVYLHAAKHLRDDLPE